MLTKRVLEQLRGEPIGERVSASEVPCNETSDEVRLCKHPVVSVAMLAFKHEKFIAQAIESIVSQKTDFEFELIISEDASPDRTREIAFEYQRRHPDKIRVLWSETNLNHIAGNGIRLWTRCRGEFVALCEGDDYWIDPLKLQKQVDVMRRHPNVSLCFSSGKYTEMNSDCLIDSDYVNTTFPQGLLSGNDFVAKAPWLITCTVLYRNAVYREAERRFLPFNWRLYMRDLTLWFGLALLGDVYCFHERFGVYRNHSGGATKRHWHEVERDANLVTAYYADLGLDAFRHDSIYYQDRAVLHRLFIISKLPYCARREVIREMMAIERLKTAVRRQVGWFGLKMFYVGGLFACYMRVRSWLRRKLGVPS